MSDISDILSFTIIWRKNSSKRTKVNSGVGKMEMCSGYLVQKVRVVLIATVSILLTLGSAAVSVAQSNTVAPAGTIKVVEFFHQDLRFYFRTGDAAEISLLDSGIGGPAWMRTGDDFLAYPISAFPATASPVCRFYGSVDPGPNTHFYSAKWDECDAVVTYFSKIIDPKTPKISYEKSTFAIEEPSAGKCAASRRPIFRLFNNGDRRGVMPNHRFTTIQSEYARLQSEGWSGEGIVMCEASPPTESTVLSGTIKGIEYKFSTGQAGIVSARGTVPFTSDGTITFSVGNISLGTYPASLNYTFTNGGLSAESVRNLLRFLMAIDSNDTVADGISVSQLTRAALSPTNKLLDFAAGDFDTQLTSLLSSAVLAGGSEGSTVKSLESVPISTDAAASRFLLSAEADRFFADVRLLRYLRGTANASSTFRVGDTLGKRSKQYYYLNRVLPDLSAESQVVAELVSQKSTASTLAGSLEPYVTNLADGMSAGIATALSLQDGASAGGAAAVGAGSYAWDLAKDKAIEWVEVHVCATAGIWAESLCRAAKEAVDVGETLKDCVHAIASAEAAGQPELAVFTCKTVFIKQITSSLATILKTVDVGSQAWSTSYATKELYKISAVKAYLQEYADSGIDIGIVAAKYANNSCASNSQMRCILIGIDNDIVPKTSWYDPTALLDWGQSTRVDAAIERVQQYLDEAQRFADETRNTVGEQITGLGTTAACISARQSVEAAYPALDGVSGAGRLNVEISNVCRATKLFTLMSSGVPLVVSEPIQPNGVYKRQISVSVDSNRIARVRISFDGTDIYKDYSFTFDRVATATSATIRRVSGDVVVGSSVDLQVVLSQPWDFVDLLPAPSEGRCYKKSASDLIFTCVFASVGDVRLTAFGGTPLRQIGVLTLPVASKASPSGLPKIISGGPLQAITAARSTYSFQAQNIQTNATIRFDDSDCGKTSVDGVGMASQTISVECTPRQSGTKRLRFLTAADGYEFDYRDIEITSVSAGEQGVYSIAPSSAGVGLPVVFTLLGQNLTSPITVSIDECSGLVATLESTQRVTVRCTPIAQGSKFVIVTLASGRKQSYTVDFTTNQPPVISFVSGSFGSGNSLTVSFRSMDPEGGTVGEDVYISNVNSATDFVEATRQQLIPSASGTLRTVNWAASKIPGGASPGGVYYVKVRGFDNASNSSTLVSPAIRVGQPVTNAPPSISAASATVNSDKSLTISFTAIDPENGPLGADVYLSNSGGSSSGFNVNSKRFAGAATSGAARSYTYTPAEVATFLVGGQSYMARVNIYDNASASAERMTNTFIVPAAVNPVNGVCGSANGGQFATAPAANLCAVGSPSGVGGTGPWNWSCAGTSGGTAASCSAAKTPVAVAVPTLTSVSPTSVSAGTAVPYAQVMQLNGFSLDNAVFIEWRDSGVLYATWSKAANGTWTSSSGVGVTLTQTATLLTVTPTLVKVGDTWTGTHTWTVTVRGAGASTTQSFAVTRSNAPTPVNGVCGTANGGQFTTAPTANLCSVGLESGVTGIGPWNWSCAGTGGGAAASCSAAKTPVAVVVPTLTSISPTTVSAGATVPYAQVMQLNGTNLDAVTTIEWRDSGVLYATWSKAANGTWTSSSGVGVTLTQTATLLTVTPTLVKVGDTWTGTHTWTVTVSAAGGSASQSFAVTRSSAPAPVNGVCGAANGTTVASIPTTNLCSVGTPSVVSGTGPWTWTCAGSAGGAAATCNAAKTVVTAVAPVVNNFTFTFDAVANEFAGFFSIVDPDTTLFNSISVRIERNTDAKSCLIDLGRTASASTSFRGCNSILDGFSKFLAWATVVDDKGLTATVGPISIGPFVNTSGIVINAPSQTQSGAPWTVSVTLPQDAISVKLNTISNGAQVMTGSGKNWIITTTLQAAVTTLQTYFIEISRAGDGGQTLTMNGNVNVVVPVVSVVMTPTVAATAPAFVVMNIAVATSLPTARVTLLAPWLTATSSELALSPAVPATNTNTSFSTSLTPRVSAGTYSMTFRAYDVNNQMTAEVVRSVVVTQPAYSIIIINLPATLAFNEQQPWDANVQAGVPRLAVYEGNTLVADSVLTGQAFPMQTSNHHFVTGFAVAGAHNLELRAYDSTGTLVATKATTVTVTAPTTFTVTQPLPASIVRGGTFTVTGVGGSAAVSNAILKFSGTCGLGFVYLTKQPDNITWQVSKQVTLAQSCPWVFEVRDGQSNLLHTSSGTLAITPDATAPNVSFVGWQNSGSAKPTTGQALNVGIDINGYASRVQLQFNGTTSTFELGSNGYPSISTASQRWSLSNSAVYAGGGWTLKIYDANGVLAQTVTGL